MAMKDRIEQEFGCLAPTKPIIHVYAVGGNSISAGTLQYNSDSGAVLGLEPQWKAKYWESTHTNVLRLQSSYMSAVNLQHWMMKPVIRQDEPNFIGPNLATDKYSSPMIIFPKLRELYSNAIDIGFCHVWANGTGFRNLNGTNNWNVNEAHPQYQSKNLTRTLLDHLKLTVMHVTAMGYDVRVKGILFLGQSVIDVQGIQAATYSKAQFKTDFEAAVNLFRTIYPNVAIYTCETTQMTGYPTQGAQWNDAINELNVTLGNIVLHNGTKWWNVSNDGVHPNGRSGVYAWGEGAVIDGKKNLAQLIYEKETT